MESEGEVSLFKLWVLFVPRNTFLSPCSYNNLLYGFHKPVLQICLPNYTYSIWQWYLVLSWGIHEIDRHCVFSPQPKIWCTPRAFINRCSIATPTPPSPPPPPPPPPQNHHHHHHHHPHTTITTTPTITTVLLSWRQHQDFDGIPIHNHFTGA